MFNKLTSEEKYFITCFLEKKQNQIQPKYKNCISLYTYLDGTSENINDQKIQLKSNDLDIIKWLNIIRKNPNNKTIKNFINSEIKSNGYYSSKIFENNIKIIIEWINNPEDINLYCKKIAKDLKSKKNKLDNNISTPSKNSFQFLEEEDPQEIKEMKFLEYAFRCNNSEYPKIVVPESPFCSEFSKESRFFAAIVAFQFKKYPNISIETPEFFRNFKYETDENIALNRWIIKYDKIQNDLEINKKNEIKRKEEKDRQAAVTNLLYENHVSKVLGKRKSKSPAIAGRGSQNEDWGRTTRPKLVDTGNDWREQK